MATDQETTSAGFRLPQGTDFISTGDDDISHNARATVDLFKKAKTKKPVLIEDLGLPITPETLLNTLPDNEYVTRFGATSLGLGCPVELAGEIVKRTWGANSGLIRFTTREIYPQVYERARLSSDWADWHRVDAGAVELPDNVTPHQMLPASPASFKKVATDLTIGYGGAVFGGSGTTAVIQSIHEQADLLDVHIRNWNPRYTNDDRPPVVLSNVRVGRHIGNGQGTDWITLNSGSTGTAGYHSETIAIPAAWRGNEVVVEYTWSGSEITRCLGTGWTDGVADSRPPMFVWIGTRLPSSVPVISAIGSSTSGGVGATRPVIDSWLSKLARNIGAAPTSWANSGDSALGWLTDADRKYQRYSKDIAAPDMMFYALLSNDWSLGATFEQMAERLQTHIGQIREHILTPIYGTTITPRSPKPANDNERLELNAYMRVSGLFEWVFDFDAPMALPDGTLNPALTSDGTHPNDAGHTALMNAVDLPIVVSA